MPTTHPSKEQVREVMTQNRKAGAPPLSPDEFRRQLGWKMIPANRSK